MDSTSSAELRGFIRPLALWEKLAHGSVRFLYPNYFAAGVRAQATEGSKFQGVNSEGKEIFVTFERCSKTSLEFNWTTMCGELKYRNKISIEPIRPKKNLLLESLGAVYGGWNNVKPSAKCIGSKITWRISSKTSSDALEIEKSETFKLLEQHQGPDVVVFKKQRFLNALHQKYIINLASQTDTFGYWAAEHLRMSGVYWGLTAMHLLRAEHRMPMEEIVEWVLLCQDPETGGFGGNEGHDAHMLYTLSAVQILALCESLHRLDTDLVIRYVAGLQQDDGSFVGDKWGEVDTRFTYCALSTLSILGGLSAIDVDHAAEYIGRCRNFDGGFGCVPGAESHAGQIFTCVGALCIANRLDLLDADLLGWWLCERQVDSGGLNGRPEKQADVCYSWWVLSSLSAIGRLSWLDADKLVGFILECQDDVAGGISDRPDDMADVYHTFFGICGLCLLGWMDKSESPWCYRNVDPVYALPTDVVARLGLHSPRLYLPASKSL